MHAAGGSAPAAMGHGGGSSISARERHKLTKGRTVDVDEKELRDMKRKVGGTPDPDTRASAWLKPDYSGRDPHAPDLAPFSGFRRFLAELAVRTHVGPRQDC